MAFLMLSMLLFNCNRENEQQNDQPNEQQNDQPNEQQNTIPNAVYDVDGNSYDAVHIGKQVWMKTNLRTKHFRDGKAIPMGNDYSNTEPYYYEPTTAQIPGYDAKTYGLYYNWSTVADNRGLCPTGWHVPSNTEWTELEEYVGSKSEYCIDGNPVLIAKALASTDGWEHWSETGTPGCNPEKNNASGFSAEPAGFYDNGFSGAGVCTYFWSATECDSYYAWFRGMSHDVASLYRYNGYPKRGGFSIRCLRD